MTTLLLDPDIRDWVVLPLFFIMIAAGLLRHYMALLLQAEWQPTPVVVQQSLHTLQQCSRIRSAACQYTTTPQWLARKHYYVQYLDQQASWAEAEQTKLADASDDLFGGGMNPLNMMKGNMAFMVQNMVMMQGIQHFFSGFVLLKIPFSLTAGFRSMFQKGMAELPDLEASYVSSVSWYFLLMYGLRAFFRVVIGDVELEAKEQVLRNQQLGLRLPPNPGDKSQDPNNMAKMLKTESENFELMLQDHKSEMDGVEKRLLGKRYPKKQLGEQDAAAEFLLLGGGSSNSGSSKKASKKSN